MTLRKRKRERIQDVTIFQGGAVRNHIPPSVGAALGDVFLFFFPPSIVFRLREMKPGERSAQQPTIQAWVGGGLGVGVIFTHHTGRTKSGNHRQVQMNIFICQACVKTCICCFDTLRFSVDNETDAYYCHMQRSPNICANVIQLKFLSLNHFPLSASHAAYYVDVSHLAGQNAWI